MRPLFHLVLIFIFVASSTVHAAEQVPAASVEPKKPVAETTAALAKAPTCDGDLIDELQMHLTGYRCLTYFDTGCLKIYSAIGASFAAATATVSALPQFRDRATKHAFVLARDALKAETAGVLGSAEFKAALQAALDSVDGTVGGKYLTGEAMRARAIKALEEMATKDAEASLKIRAAALAASKVASVQAMRHAAAWAGVGATALSIVTGPVLMYFSMVSPAGGDKCTENGFQFVDSRPTEDEKSCEFSFNPAGAKFRSFFRESRESQLRVLKNDTTTCEYMHFINEALKGHLLTELQILNRAKFNQLPTCRPGKAGVEYEVDLEHQRTKIEAIMDPETQRVRTIKMSNPVKDVMGAEVGDRGQITVSYQDEAAGSKPYQVVMKNGSTPSTPKNFGEFLEMSRNDRRYERAVKVLNQGAFWTKVVSSCCEKDEKEGQRENCWRDKLPGLKLEQEEAKKKEENPTADPGSKAPGKQ